MSLWRQLTRGLRVLTNRPRPTGTSPTRWSTTSSRRPPRGVARGLSPERGAARRAARAGQPDRGPASRCAATAGRTWSDGCSPICATPRAGCAPRRASPAITVLTLALGIGATTAIFSAVNPILFEPLPYPDADRIAMILELGSDGSRNAGTFGIYRELVERSRSFEAIAVLRAVAADDDRGGRAGATRRAAGERGLLPGAGRAARSWDGTSRPSDDRLNGPNVVILSDALWRRRFGGDRAIVGRQITLDDNSLHWSSASCRPASRTCWLPRPSCGRRCSTTCSRGPGVGPSPAHGGAAPAGRHHRSGAAGARRARRAPSLAEQRPRDATTRDTRFIADRLQDDLTRGVKPALLAILGAVMLVLVIACVNVTNLLLARGVQRRGEFALRAALGAGRGRLIRQLLTESLLLACVGGAAGMAVAVLGVRALVALSPPGLPRVGAIGSTARCSPSGWASPR